MAKRKTRTNRTQKRSTPDWAPRFLLKLAECANIRDACKAAKIGRQTFYDRREKDSAFAKEVAHALEDACDELEAEGRRRALDSSDGMLMFMLKAHRPSIYKDKVDHSHGGSVDLRVTLAEVLKARQEADQWERDREQAEGATEPGPESGSPPL